MKEFRIYTTSGCNKACPFCSYRYRFNPEFAGHPIWDLPQAVVNLSHMRKDFDVPMFMFSGVEPTLDNTWMKLALASGIQEAAINTNGLKWRTKEGVDELTKQALELEKNNIRFWSYISINTPGDEDAFTAIDDHNHYLIYDSQVTPYIVVNKENWDYVLKMMDYLTSLGIWRAYIRFEVPVKPDRKEHCFPKEQHKAKLAAMAHVFESGGGECFDFPIDAHPDQYAFIPEKMGEVEIRQRFVHSQCRAYTDSLTILQTGEILGCAKHTYLQEPNRFIVGNILSYDFLTVRDNIKKAPKNYCLGTERA